MTDAFMPPPETQTGLSHLVGALVLVHVLKFDPAMPSSISGMGKEGIIADIAIVDFPQDPSRVGEVLTAFPVLNVGIVMSLKQAVGSTVLGRLYAKQTRAGQSPAIILSAFTPADAELARAFMAKAPAPAAPSVPPAPAPFAPSVVPPFAPTTEPPF
jgi:hypothetical protein